MIEVVTILALIGVLALYLRWLARQDRTRKSAREGRRLYHRPKEGRVDMALQLGARAIG